MTLLCLFFWLAQMPRPSVNGWHLDRLHEVEKRASLLNIQDQGVLKKALGRIADLRAEKVLLPAGTIYFVQATGNYYCSPTGNCSTYLVSGDGYVLLSTIAQQIGIDRSSSSGHPDIITSMHGSAFESGLKLWRFAGTKYKRIACAESNYRDEDGNDLTSPRLTSTPCR